MISMDLQAYDLDAVNMLGGYAQVPIHSPPEVVET